MQSKDILLGNSLYRPEVIKGALHVRIGHWPLAIEVILPTNWAAYHQSNG